MLSRRHSSSQNGGVLFLYRENYYKVEMPSDVIATLKQQRSFTIAAATALPGVKTLPSYPSKVVV